MNPLQEPRVPHLNWEASASIHKATSAANLCTCPLSGNVKPDALLDETQNIMAQCDILGATCHLVNYSGYMQPFDGFSGYCRFLLSCDALL